MPRSLRSTRIRRLLVAGMTLASAFGHVVVTPTGASAIGGPAVTGVWSDVQQWPGVAVHTHLLPDGKVMAWPRVNESGGSRPAPWIWDPIANMVRSTSLPPYDIFCSGHTLTPDGKLLVMGGHVEDFVGLPDVASYDPHTDRWTRLPSMNEGRWYPSGTVLANGDVLVAAGTTGGSPYTENRVPQVWDRVLLGWRSLTAAPRNLGFYPWMFVAPNGDVFDAGPANRSYYLDATGGGTWQAVADLPHDRFDGSAVMYEPGKVLAVGGGPGGELPTATADVIDLNQAEPQWTRTGSMQHRRQYATATILPDGTVLETGGTSSLTNDVRGAVLEAELWDPKTGDWTTFASMQTPRLYHSTALLLPDGRVLVAGGGQPNALGDTGHHPDYEIFSPPYLFAGARPSIDSAPAFAEYGGAFLVTTPDSMDIADVTLVRVGSTTHAYNQSQRFVRPGFFRTPAGIVVVPPAHPNSAPPGPYMLFLINRQGVPSVAHILSLGVSALGLPLPVP